MVVVVDRGPEGGGRSGAVGAQHGGGRVDGVDRVVGRRGSGTPGSDGGVGGEGRRLELHRALGPGGGWRPTTPPARVDCPLPVSTVPMAASTDHDSPGQVAAACW